MAPLLDEPQVAARLFDHIDKGETDLGERGWREPVANYRSAERLDAELKRAFRSTPTAFCPSAALSRPGSYVARSAGGTPILAVRGADGVARAFRNACRHRGAEVARGSGEAKAFTCPYHAWTYGLDGALRGVPHEYGFPGLDKACNGLVPLDTSERGGLVFVTQTPGLAPGPTDHEAVSFLGPDMRLISTTEQVTEANWKVLAEGFLEGYHILPTHRETFYPVQYDNLNVIEHFGRNSRVTFPYRNIEKLRGVEASKRRVGGVLTFVYHLFPNVIVATFPKRTVVAVLEPEGLERTRTINYNLAREQDLRDEPAAVEQATDFVNAGANEDRAVVESIQRGMAAGANDAFQFGLFEAAIVHFHRNLHEVLGEP